MNGNLCAVCSKPSEKFCSACQKAFYCSSECQKEDWKVKGHKSECFPARVVHNKEEGRFLVATKDLKAGDLIFKDEELISGPTGAELSHYDICLACYRVLLQPEYKCPKCQWYLCSPECSSSENHAKFECQIFAQRRITRFTKPHQYAYLYILRTLLLRDSDPQQWEKVMDFVSHEKERSENQILAALSKETGDFIRNKCGQIQFDYDIIHKVEGIWTINSYGMGSLPSNSSSAKAWDVRLATFLFPRLKFASHNCAPNTRGVIHLGSKSRPKLYRMELYAAQPILKGSSITTTYIDIGLGTVERRRMLSEGYCFECNCFRCSDPTELKSYSSALICQSCPEGGYLLPVSPLDFKSDWGCTKNCPELCKYGKIEGILMKIKIDLNLILESKYGAPIEVVEKLEELLSSVKGISLHENHWLVCEIELQLILGLLHSVGRIEPGRDGAKKRIVKLIELCKHLLGVADLIRPGMNIYRGRLLYYLVQGRLKYYKLFGFDPKRLKGEMGTLEEAKREAEEGRKILSFEPEGSEEKKMAVWLEKDISEIDLLLSLNTPFGVKPGLNGENKYKPRNGRNRIKNKNSG